ncbi:MAG: MlaD family protein [Solirubrobacteraceae bacterium]
MRRLILSFAILLAVGPLLVIAGGAAGGVSSGDGAAGTYRIEFDNAFGLVTGADFKVAGVPAGTIKSIGLDQSTLHAVVSVQVTQNGFGSFRSDVFCQSRPQSLIGEYFIDCDPGQSSTMLRPGSTIPVSRTQSTIPADLLQNVMRMPYRERLALIVNELGAGVANRSEDLQAALARAVPALTETDNLLGVLASDSKTIQDLALNADSVTSALANNRTEVQRFITEANRTATATATQRGNLSSTLQKLPAFLEQLRPALTKLGAATDANQPVVQNLNAASGQLHRLLTDLPPFSHSALPAIRSLGRASVTGKAAVQAAGPTVMHLNQFAARTPELAQNLAIVLRDLDARGRAVEPDSRSPGGKGYTGLEALLQYVFNQALAINTYGPLGHMLSVDAFIDPACTGYATPGTIATNLKLFGPSYRRCYSWLGSHQPGVNAPDPSNPGPSVPDPGGAPPGLSGSAPSVSKLVSSNPSQPRSGPAQRPASVPDLPQKPSPIPTAAGAGSSPATNTTSPNTTPSSDGTQAQQLLNYLLAP